MHTEKCLDRTAEKTDLSQTLPFSGNIYITDSFEQDVHRIYGGFQASDEEYPALAVTTEGTPLFVECVELPPGSFVRRRATDQIIGDHPAAQALWTETVERYSGKCRHASIHIHPMDYPKPSYIDIDGYEKIRTSPSAPNTFEGDQPYPFILVNLHHEELQLLGFWVMYGRCFDGHIVRLPDDDPFVSRAWESATPLAYYSREARCVQRIKSRVSDEWTVALGVRARDGAKAIRVLGPAGEKLLLAFDDSKILGLRSSLIDDESICVEDYIDWESLFSALAAAEQPASGIVGAGDREAIDDGTPVEGREPGHQKVAEDSKGKEDSPAKEDSQAECPDSENPTPENTE